MSSATSYFHTGFSVDHVPDMAGKVVIVTGGNTGLGYETVLQLAKKGALVFLAARSPERASAAMQKLQTDIGSEAAARVEFLRLDLQDLKQVKSAAQEFLDRKLPLHVLVNNAGIMAPPFGLTKDGIETQLGTNHVGHFALTQYLLPALLRETPSRIVNLSSFGHNFSPKGGILFDRINDEGALSAWQRYGQSKLANILFTKALDKRYGNRGVLANACHPGAVATELNRGPIELYGLNGGIGMLLRPLLRLIRWSICMDPAQGALTQIYLASAPEIAEKGVRGKYFVPFGYQLDGPGLSEDARDECLAERLWDWTEKIVQEKTAG